MTPNFEVSFHYTVISHEPTLNLEFNFNTFLNVIGESYRARRGWASQFCLDLPNYMIDRVSSINTENRCVILFANQNCNGDNVRVAPGTPSHNNLAGIGFNDKTYSYRSCNRREYSEYLRYMRRMTLTNSTDVAPSFGEMRNNTITTTEESSTLGSPATQT